MGPEHEQSLPAEILAADLSLDRNADLAFLIVKGARPPPPPIDLLTKSDTTEGMPCVAAGFPFGGRSVAITRGGIARLVRDEYGQLESFEVASSLQPGYSGGPIVEATTGTLIGVVLADAESPSTTTHVIPAEEVRRAMAGRVGALELTLLAIGPKNAELKFRAQILDPKQTVQDVMINVAGAADGTVNPNDDGTWPPIRNSTSVELRSDPGKDGSVTGSVRLALAAGARRRA